MSYVDAFLDRKNDRIHVAERTNGKRVLADSPVNYVFYHEHSDGSHRSIFGHACKKYTTHSAHKFRAFLRDQQNAGKRVFESDVNPLFRFLSDTYSGKDAPVLNIGFFDIEVDFHLERGFAPPEDPFNAITAVTLYRSADQRLLTFVLRPPTVDLAEAQRIGACFTDTQVFDDEKAMLLAFLDAIDDVDVLTGWNSGAYDVPYLVNRVSMLLDKSTTRRFSLWDQLPSPREYLNKFGRMVKTYDFVGRVHLDYLDLYAKHTPQQRLSYALNAIGEIEVGESKVQYEGTLDDLYKKDFHKFIDYNRQDVALMVKIDAKLKFIELANQIAHANGVLLKTTMGSVALIDQAITNEMHAMGFVVPDKNRHDDADEDVVDGPDYDEYDDEEPAAFTPGKKGEKAPVVGAYVADPKKGLQEWIGCVDINSLYPSAIRALNMSPETLVGQVRHDETMALIQKRIAEGTPRAEAWEGLFSTLEVQHMHDQDDTVLTVEFIDRMDDSVRTVKMTGRELHDFVFDEANHVCITANGTLFRTDVEGMIPHLLGKWYADRKDLQKTSKKYAEEAKGQQVEELKKQCLAAAQRYDSLQMASKIRLNSLYGTLLNEASKFYDERLGQSTTLSGRSIDRHMAAKINEIITGVYDHRGDSIVYCDTDSSYFTIATTWKDNPDYADFEWSKENIIGLYDLIAEEANATFPEFMDRSFHTGLERGGIIKAGRELVASKGLFIKKKKYAVLQIEKEGTRLDVDGKAGKLKAMGLDLKRSDTPKYMQQFLEKLLMDLLTDVSREDMFANITEFRKVFKTRPGWEKGAPKKVSNLSGFANKMENSKGLSLKRANKSDKFQVNMPGHVRASLNWNALCEANNDRHALRISDGTRIIVCKLLPNTLGMTSIAYPIDEPHIPQWFKDLPFDHTAMEETIIDNKVLNLVGVLEWDLSDTKQRAGAAFFDFDG